MENEVKTGIPFDVYDKLESLASELELIRFVTSEIYEISSPIIKDEKEEMIAFWFERKRLFNLSRILLDYVHNQIIAIEEILKHGC